MMFLFLAILTGLLSFVAMAVTMSLFERCRCGFDVVVTTLLGLPVISGMVTLSCYFADKSGIF